MTRSNEHNESRLCAAPESEPEQAEMTAPIDLSRFDDVEVMPVWEDPDQGFCEPVPDAPHTATFWTVYGHLREGGAEALIDCYDERSAEMAASVLEQALRVPGLESAAQATQQGGCDDHHE